MIKKLCMILVIIVFCTMFTGCFDADEVDELAFVVAIGIDKGKTNIARVTLQMVKPAAIGAGGQGGGEGGEKAVTVITIEAPAVISALDQANNLVSKKIDLSHAKTMVFSREVATEGIEAYINAFPRIREIRPNIEIIVSRDSAEEYIKAATPILEINPAKYYELTYDTFSFTGFTESTDLHSFSWKAKSGYQSPVATLAGVSKFNNSNEIDSSASTYKEKGRPFPLEGDYKAGDLPKVGDIKAEIMGLAVFNHGKMVGELDGEETMFHLMVGGNYEHSYVTIPDPLKNDTVVIADVFQSRKPVSKIRFDNGKPVIDVKVSLEANIYSIQSGIEYENPKNTIILEKAYEDFILKGIEKYLNRTAQEFHSDICGFGKIVKGRFLTWDEWEKFGWPNRYKDSRFTVNTDLKIRRTGLMVRTMPIK